MYSNFGENPLVTVYIPTYNRLDLLTRAIESVRNQTYQNLEIIIVDDGSKDGTHEYLQRLHQVDPRVYYIIKEKNSGACESRNIAIKRANGYFITGLDDDDYFEKNRIENFINAAKKDHKKAYYSRIKVKISENEVRLPSMNTLLRCSEITSHKELLKQNFIGNQLFVKTEILRNAGGFDKNLKAWQDLECWFNLIKTQHISIFRLDEPTQVVDVSHTHERITTKKLGNVVEAYEYFVQKHHLSSVERYILQGQLINYTPEKFNFLQKIMLFLLTRQAFYLKKIW